MRTRRDPRTEREARLVPDAQRRRFTLIAAPFAPTGRPRRDPRARRIAATIWAPLRPRIDWNAGQSAPAASGARPDVHAAAAPEIRIIAEPAFFVLAVVDQRAGRFRNMTGSLLRPRVKSPTRMAERSSFWPSARPMNSPRQARIVRWPYRRIWRETTI